MPNTTDRIIKPSEECNGMAMRFFALVQEEFSRRENLKNELIQLVSQIRIEIDKVDLISLDFAAAHENAKNNLAEIENKYNSIYPTYQTFVLSQLEKGIKPGLTGIVREFHELSSKRIDAKNKVIKTSKELKNFMTFWSEEKSKQLTRIEEYNLQIAELERSSPTSTTPLRPA